jgi:hypothetical protein
VEVEEEEEEEEEEEKPEGGEPNVVVAGDALLFPNRSLTMALTTLGSFTLINTWAKQKRATLQGALASKEEEEEEEEANDATPPPPPPPLPPQ